MVGHAAGDQACERRADRMSDAANRLAKAVTAWKHECDTRPPPNESCADWHDRMKVRWDVVANALRIYNQKEGSIDEQLRLERIARERALYKQRLDQIRELALSEPMYGKEFVLLAEIAELAEV